MLRFVFLIVAVLLMSSPQSKADELWGGLQITCIPSLEYFAVRTIQIPLTHKGQNVMDNNSTAADAIEHMQRENGVFTAKTLLEHPYTCNLPARALHIKIADYVAPHYPGECGLLENFQVVINANENFLYKFSPYGINRCTDHESHLVEITHFDLIDCTMHSLSGTQSVCNRSRNP